MLILRFVSLFAFVSRIYISVSISADFIGAILTRILWFCVTFIFKLDSNRLKNNPNIFHVYLVA